MDRKVYVVVDLKMNLVLQVEDGVEIGSVLDDLDFSNVTHERNNDFDLSEVGDIKVVGHEIIDSK